MRKSVENRQSLLLHLAFLLLIIAIGAFLRIQAIQDTEVVAPLRADAGQYVSYAMNTIEHHTYSRQPFNQTTDPTPDAVRSPVYPMMIAAVLSASPRAPLILIQYLQAALSIATILLGFLLFRRFLPLVWANGAALLIAISPHLVVANVYILTESLFTFALVGCLLIITYAYERNGKTLAFVGGVTLGLLNLTRSAVQYFIVVLAALSWIRGQSARFTIILIVGFLLVFGAWTLRNVSSIGETADDTLKINFLHHGMYPDFKYQERQDTYGFPYRYDPESARISESTSTILIEIFRRFREEPARHVRWFTVGKPVAFWQWDMVQGMGDIYIYPVTASPYFSRPLFQWTHSVSKVLHTPLVILGLLGSAFCWFAASHLHSRSGAFCIRLVAAMIIYYQLIHMVGAPFPRYSVPLRPLIYAMAMYFLYTSWTLVYGRYIRQSKVLED